MKPNRNILSWEASLTTTMYDDKGLFAIRYIGEAAKKYSNQILNFEVGAQF